MKWFIRFFFRTVRRVLGPIMLFIDKMTSPAGIKRSAEKQQQLDQLTANMALYQFRTCPFCIKVRREIKRQSLNIELRDAQYNQQHRQQLLNEGGKIKVPCLRVVDKEGQHTWLYESDDVIQYLRQLVA